MGKRRALIYAVQKAVTCESKQKREKKSRKPRRWFGKRRRSVDMNSARAENAAVVVVPLAHSPMEEVKLIEAENEQSRHAYSVALVTAMAAEAAVAAANAAAEVVRLRSTAGVPGKSKEETAAIKIQTAFRGYLARRAMKALKCLVRLKSLIGGQSVKRQSTATLKCMQTLARVQSEVRARRIRIPDKNSNSNQIEHNREKELDKSRMGENWDASTQSKEQIEAHLRYKQEAALRRERALAYAYSHQQTRRISTSPKNQTFVDPNNPNGGWSWLERWMAARPWENENGNAVQKESNNDAVSAKSGSTHSVSVRGESKIQSPNTRKQARPKSKHTRKIRPLSPRSEAAGSPYDDDGDSKSMNSAQSELYRRRRSVCGGSSARDDESYTSSPSAVPSYMASTESARAKSRLGTPEKSSVSGGGGSAKKRLSYTGSPAGGRRVSGLAKTEY